MGTPFQTELSTKNHPLTCLNRVIDETKLIRSIIKSRDLILELKKVHPYSERLTYLDDEIAYLEEKLAQVSPDISGNT